ncbi:HlyU family transcriptional regulator [Pararhizobium sp.]|uniref:HlyU family transcriptional regulator n=1 Tax=Pararhizobium sp. TaxID=1977563 RepID=UPI002727AEDB|nr:HlyU family transcriptional regulator [Pararhizobium sp.]MDO9416951.1 HlyU family transcriptional regulator [Pararhizobium sp.]
MASFISKILGMFSGSGASAPEAPADKTETYADCLIRARPMREGSQFRLAGSIEKTGSEPLKTRTFIRADVFASEQDAIDASFRKARQIIDQNGASLFSDDAETRQA